MAKPYHVPSRSYLQNKIEVHVKIALTSTRCIEFIHEAILVIFVELYLCVATVPFRICKTLACKTKTKTSKILNCLVWLSISLPTLEISVLLFHMFFK